MNAIPFFYRPHARSLDRYADLVELYDDDLASIPVAPSLLNRAASATAGVLEGAMAEKTRLTTELADLTEQLRQVEIVIDAFSSIPSKLEAGCDPAPKPRAKGRGKQ